jgi:hypothetical protein
MVYMEWKSDLYDFSDPEVGPEYVPYFYKSWKSYKAARREGYGVKVQTTYSLSKL